MTPSDPDALDAFVQQLVETSFTLITIVEAMVRFHERGSSSADAHLSPMCCATSSPPRSHRCPSVPATKG